MPDLVVHVFGKEGCSKCAALKRRLEKLFQEEPYNVFKMEYHDVLTLDGIVEFCKAEVLNPNRIPAMLVSADGKYIAGPDRFLKGPERVAASSTCQYLGIQTDYDKGSGLITPEMIKGVLDKALA